MFSAHHRLEQFFLAGEVEEQRALGHAGARGHLFAAGGGEAFFHEQVQRGVEQFARPRFLAAAAAGGNAVLRAHRLYRREWRGPITD
jgi:hypothetical protein